MKTCLTGEPTITTERAKMARLVSRVVPKDQLLHETELLAEKIASMSKITLRIYKETTLAAHNLLLECGIQFERNQSAATFATFDRHEGMDAFVHKRKPLF